MEARVNVVIDTVTKQQTNTIETTADYGITMIENDIYTHPGDWKFFGFALGIIVVVLGTAGNGLTVWAYGNNRNLQTSFNVLIANLCCMELIFSMIIIPLQLPGFITEESPYPVAMCKVVGYFYYSSMASSLINLVAIAINRYVGIVNSKSYKKLFTGYRLRIWVAVIWIVPPLLYLPIVIGGLIEFRTDTMRCSVGAAGNYGYRIYNMVLNIFFQAVGLLILIVLYALIIKKVKEVQKKLKIHKKASFQKVSKKKFSKETTGGSHTPVTTSGDEGVEDYRPSSIISGGFHFRPAKDAPPPQEWPSDSGHGSEHEMPTSHYSKRTNEQTNSRASFMTGSDEAASPQPEKRRTSLWQVLFRTKASEQFADSDKKQNGDIPYFTTDDHSMNPGTNTNESPEYQVEPEVQIVLRDMNDVKKDMRRKKSLSAPTLPSLDEILQTSRKNSAAVAQNIPEKVTEVNETKSPNSSPMRLTRAFTVGSKYQKHNSPRDVNGQFKLTAEQINLLTPDLLTVSNKLVIQNSNICTSMPTIHAHTRMGTIARKIKEQKNKSRRKPKERNERSRQRRRALRRRHARERQLVYSSLTICIAFAICILPTALTYVIQTLFDLKIPAAVILVVGCISWLHAVVNPFIYGYMNHLYRKEYGHLAKEFEKKLSACFK